MATGGCFSFVLICDSTANTPRMVGNHNRPSRLFHPAGLATPLHCTVDSPSFRPKEVQGRVLIVPRSNELKSSFFTRNMPVQQLIQKYPESSSRISYTSSLNNHWREV